jgi:transcriptional regulator
MYRVPYFNEKDSAAVLAFMKAHSFAMLIGTDQQQQSVATQIPFLFSERDGELYLQAHIMRNTDHHHAFETNQQALVIFTGPHTYVSASWYENPQQASTWNYMSVHARGTLSWLDETALLTMLDQLTAFYENNPNSPAAFDKMPSDYISRMSKAIVAFEIKVASIETVFKLSQNKEEKTYHNILEHLKKGDSNAIAIAAAMEARKNQLFPHV